MVRGENRIPYWIDRRLTGLAGPDYDAAISFGLPYEPEDSQYGECWPIRRCMSVAPLRRTCSAPSRDNAKEKAGAVQEPWPLYRRCTAILVSLAGVSDSWGR